jgi:hypothetical protein
MARKFTLALVDETGTVITQYDLVLDDSIEAVVKDNKVLLAKRINSIVDFEDFDCLFYDIARDIVLEVNSSES